VRSLGRKSKLPERKRWRLRALPWAAILQAVIVVRARWVALSSKDRARFLQLLRQSQGRAGNLSSRDRDELRKIVRKLDLKGAAGELAPALRGKGRRKRR
jgi:hypothetical protein